MPVFERHSNLRSTCAAHGKILPGVSALARLYPGCRWLLRRHPGFHALQLVATARLELVRCPDSPVPCGAAWRHAAPAAAGHCCARCRSCHSMEAGYHTAEPARVCTPRLCPLVAVSEGRIHRYAHAAHLCKRYRASTHDARCDFTRILLPQTLPIPC